MNIDPNQANMTLELSELALVKVGGKDAAEFLNNQFTNDINDLMENHWQFNGYCTAKGRLIAVMRLFKFADNFYIIIPESTAQILVQRLKIYVFRSKVSFEILDMSFYAYLGTYTAAEVATKPEPQEFTPINDGFMLNLSAQNERYLCIKDKKIEHADNLISGEIADSYWRLTEINAFIPTIFPETIEKFIPQHVNLDQINGVSFKKGCFPGQEIVARLHYLGKSKQSMQKMDLVSETEINAGDSISHPQTQKPLTIVDAVKIDNHTYQSLVVGQISE